MNSSSTRLTFLGGRSLFPRFSPDGAKIVFTSGGNGRCDIYEMNADGSDLRALTTGDGQFHEPVFSPDGTQIVFLGGHRINEETHDIWIMDADGANQRPLTSTHIDSRARWSPDGRSITFMSGRDKSLEIYRMRVDGSDQQRLTFVENDLVPRLGPPSKNLSPRYLADGSIAFLARFWKASGEDDVQRQSNRFVSQMHRVNEDGTGRMPLVDSDYIYDSPVVSNDGRLAAFCTTEEGRREAFLSVVHPDGSGVRRLEGGDGGYHAFHPSRDRIAFASFRDCRVEPATRNYDIYVIRIDDGQLERLTDNTSADTLPAFSPDGKQIAFCSNRDATFEIYTMPYDG